MVRTVNAEMAVIVLVGFLLTVSGIYLNFQNLERANRVFDKPDVLYGNEIIYGVVQIIGMAIIFVGTTRGLMRRSDIMANKFVNIMDVFTSLVKKQMEVIDSSESRSKLAEMEERSKKFKDEMGDLKRI